MSTPEFDKFDLEGLSLEEVEPAKPVEVKLPENLPKDQIEESIEQATDPGLASIDEVAETNEEQIVCPKCELVQPKVEQCSGCGVYIAKAQAQIGQSKIEITAVKF